jgi:hypothetical protein
MYKLCDSIGTPVLRNIQYDIIVACTKSGLQLDQQDIKKPSQLTPSLSYHNDGVSYEKDTAAINLSSSVTYSQ